MNMMFPCERPAAASIEEGMPSGRRMEASEAWGERWRLTASPIAKRYMHVAATKRSLVCLAADRTTMAGLFDLIETVAPYVAALKTHVDLVDDWSPEAWGRFCKAAHEADLLIFEDRKFADIGKISRAQMSGIYDVRSWSDLVTAHLISGPDVVDGLQAGWKDANREGGVLLLAQMSSRGNLLNPDYTREVVRKGCAHGGVVGFIGNGSRPEEVSALRDAVGEEKMIWTPGVNIAVGDGEMGRLHHRRFRYSRINRPCSIGTSLRRSVVERSSSTNGVSAVVVLEMLLASLSLVFPAWLIWRAFSTSRQLEQRLAQGDATRLNDDRFNIDRGTLGPAGTELIEDVQFVAVQMPSYVPVQPRVEDDARA